MDPVLCTRGALAAAVAMAFAGAAFADGPGINLPAPALQEGFSIHGLIDTGFQIHHANGTTSARMMPNGDETSAFHLRARENLHGGNYVRLKLSAPFKPDSGEFNNKNTSGDPILFNEAFVAVGGEWGELAAGRLANIFSGNGDFGLCPHINPSPMGTNFPNAGLTPIFSSGYYYNNSVIYNSPRVNGFHVILKGFLMMISGLAGDQWNEGDVSCSVVRRVVMPDSFYAADGLFETFLTVLNQMGVYEAVVAAELRRYLPFLMTTTILMEAVKRGGDRQELHERIRQHSMAATARMKEGERCDLLDRLAADPAFGMTRAELDAVMDPALYTGRCAQQVERFLSECAPLLADAQSADGAISL